jgi:hypothetical protein
VVNVGFASGTCPRCGRILYRRRPAEVAVCPCWEFCPSNHGNGAFSTKMDPYTPDLTPTTYGPIGGEGEAWGDLEHPIHIVRVCPVCKFHSAQLPVEVALE